MGLQVWQFLLIWKKFHLSTSFPLYSLIILFDWKVERKQHTSYNTQVALLGVERRSSRAEPPSAAGAATLSATCSATRRLWSSARGGTVASPSGCRPTPPELSSPPPPPPSLLLPLLSVFPLHPRPQSPPLFLTTSGCCCGSRASLRLPRQTWRHWQWSSRSLWTEVRERLSCQAVASPLPHLLSPPVPPGPADARGQGSWASEDERRWQGVRAESRILSPLFSARRVPAAPSRGTRPVEGCLRRALATSAATPSPSPGRLPAAGFVGADSRRPLGARGPGLRRGREEARRARRGRLPPWTRRARPGAQKGGSLSRRRGTKVGSAADAQAAARGRTGRTPG